MGSGEYVKVSENLEAPKTYKFSPFWGGNVKYSQAPIHLIFYFILSCPLCSL